MNFPDAEEMKTLEPLRPKDMTPEHFRTVAETKHNEMLDTFTPQIVAAIENKTIADKDFAIALINIGEDLISEEMKYQMKADGVDTALIATEKSDIIGLLKGFESPRTCTKPFTVMAAALTAYKPGVTAVVVMCFQNGSLFNVELEQLKMNLAKEAARVAAWKALNASEASAEPQLPPSDSQ